MHCSSTLDIVAASAFANGKIEHYYVSGDVVTDHTGQDVAEAVLKSLTSVLGNVNWKTRYVFSNVKIKAFSTFNFD